MSDLRKYVGVLPWNMVKCCSWDESGVFVSEYCQLDHAGEAYGVLQWIVLADKYDLMFLRAMTTSHSRPRGFPFLAPLHEIASSLHQHPRLKLATKTVSTPILRFMFRVVLRLPCKNSKSSWLPSPRTATLYLHAAQPYFVQFSGRALLI